MKKIKLAIVGVGNCACSLVQAITAERCGDLGTGLANNAIGDYAVGDIEVVAAFDVNRHKVNQYISDAIFATPNCTTRYFDVPHSDVKVSPGALLDGVAEHLRELVQPAVETIATTLDSVVEVLKKSGAEVVISYLPVGSAQASDFYAEAALRAGCAFINCMPSLIATSETWSKRFEAAGLPLLGDDIKSQIGSTSVHRALITLLEQKGVTITSSYQLNIGGNTDFLNMRAPERGATKKRTKEAALNHLFSKTAAPPIGVGPSDYVPQLKDHKVGFINIEGIGLLGMPFSIEMRLKVEDSPNSAGVAVDAIRAAKTALDRGMSGIINDVCPVLFKNPPTQLSDEDAFMSFYLFAQTQNVEVYEYAV